MKCADACELRTGKKIDFADLAPFYVQGRVDWALQRVWGTAVIFGGNFRDLPLKSQVKHMIVELGYEMSHLKSKTRRDTAHAV